MLNVVLNDQAAIKDLIGTQKTQQIDLIKNTDNLVKELNSIKAKLVSERFIIRLVKIKLNQLSAQKKLIKFLPRLRYLATPFFTNKITQTVKILMRKIVDPKLKYPIETKDELSIV